MRSRIRSRDVREPNLGGSARHEALYRRRMARDRRLGRAVDADLQAHDVRLTMGGEPTFVSIDDPDGEEWNTTALGPNKKQTGGGSVSSDSKALRRAGSGSFRSRQVVSGRAAAALVAQLLLAQGWRTDLAERVADRGRIEAWNGNGSKCAANFLRGVAERLGLDAQLMFPAYEDAFYYLWRERRLPSNVDPFDARLDDELERKRLARVFSQGLKRRVGEVLPLARDLRRRLAYRLVVFPRRALLSDPR